MLVKGHTTYCIFTQCFYSMETITSQVKEGNQNLLCDNENNNYQQHAVQPNFWISLTHTEPK